MRPIVSALLSSRGHGWIISIVLLILSSIGLAAIYSVDLSRGESLIFFPTQIIALGIGLAVFFIAGSQHVARFFSLAKIGYLVGLIVLLSVLFFGVTVRGTTGWFRMFGFSFQPAEFAKVALVLLLAWVIHKQGRRFDRFEFILSTGLAAGLYVILILLQPDFGTAFIFVGLWFGLLLLCRVRVRYSIGLVLLGISILAVGWFFVFADYQKERLLTFVDPQRDPLGSGYNVSQSIIAIGSGQWGGRGLGFGSQSQLHFLPEAQTDFIVAVIGEELGFVGIFALVSLYVLLLMWLVRVAAHARDDFAAYTVLGTGVLLFLQMAINIGGTMGLLPVTGITLPFVSYGGSSLIMHFFLMGVSVSIARTGTA